MNIPILRGRDITTADNTNAPGVVIVNEFLANRYWPGEDPIGKRITLGDPAKSPSWLTVVGVVKNVVRSEWSAAAEEEMYLPFLQDKFYLSDPSAHAAYLTLVVRTTNDPKTATGNLESTIHTLDKNATISQVATMDDVVAESNAQPRFYLLLLGSFAALALALAAVGIYGVMSHSVSRRTHEMAVRMALGARQTDVLRLVVGESMMLAAIGGVVGIAAALALTPLMSSLLYGTRAADPLTFAAVATVLGLVALLASYVPARRATKVDPVVALRYE
jgi:putative ABC transport system permease protein